MGETEQSYRVCGIKGCILTNSFTRGYCNKHYRELLRTNSFTDKTMFDERPAILKETYALIPYGLNAKDGYAKVDLEDAWVAKYKWNKQGPGYGTGWVNGKNMLLHHLIVGKAPDGLDIDHINRDPSDNRKANLRVVDRSTNLRNKGLSPRNTSGYRNVYWNKRAKRWNGQVIIHSKCHSVGYFDSAEECAEAVKQYKKRVGIYEPVI